MISGFMIVRDVLGQGYPFVEAIASALPICDEFVISDGYSTDGTYEVLERVATLNAKVKVYRYRWPEKKDLRVLADVTNEVRKKCNFQYIFSVQANEIIHQDSVPFIKALPSMLPHVNTFSFPYLQLLNNNKLTEEFRLRFSKNLPQIVAIGDAWTLGASKSFERAKKIRAIAHPRMMSRYISHGIGFNYANSCYGPHSRAIYLPKPVFRYWSLFPVSFLEKCRKHAELFAFPEFQQTSDLLKSQLDKPEVFWRAGSEFLKNLEFKEAIQYSEEFRFVDKKDHPAIIQDFISNPHADKYYVREELFELIEKL